MSLKAPAKLSVVPAVRSAATDDVVTLTSLINRAYVVEAPFVSGPRVDTNDVSARLERGRFLVADGDDGPVGAIFVEIADGVGRIELLAVAPELQGQGIGHRLLGVAESLCRAEGCSETELEVVSQRDELFLHCRRADYIPVGTTAVPTAAATDTDCHFVVMRKQLVEAARQLAI